MYRMTHASHIGICMQCNKKSNVHVIQAGKMPLKSYNTKPLEVAIRIEQVRLGESAQKHALSSNMKNFYESINIYTRTNMFCTSHRILKRHT